MSEIKYNIATAAINQDVNTGYISLLNPSFQQGVDKNQRIGNKIKYRNFTVKLSVFLDETNPTIGYFARCVRIIIIQPRTQFNSPVALLDIFDTNNNFLSTIKGTAVRVMYDKMFTVIPTTSPLQHGTNTQRILKKLVFRTKNSVTFRDSTVTIPTDYKDIYYLIIVTDALAVGAGAYTIQGNWYVRQSFIDL